MEVIGGDEKKVAELWKEIRLKARDHARSPVQVSVYEEYRADCLSKY